MPRVETADCRFVIKQGPSGPYVQIEFAAEGPASLGGAQLILRFRHPIGTIEAQVVAGDLHRHFDKLTVLKPE